MPDAGTDPGRRRQARRDDQRFRLLRALGVGTGHGQRELARATGMSLGTANALLNRMIADGLVRAASDETAPAGFRLDYTVTDAGRAETARLAPGYLARRRAEYAALAAEIAALEVDVGPGDDPQT